MANRLLIIDGDAVAYRQSAGAQKQIQLEAEEDGAEPTTLRFHDTADVEQVVDSAMAALIQAYKPTKTVVALSDEVNFRIQLCPTYKGNRSDVLRPTGLADAKEYLAANWPLMKLARLEADDTMGIAATRPDLLSKYDEVVLCSDDKDMRTIPCLLGSMFHGKVGTVVKVSAEEADNWHLMQTLMGDTADGYKGCPGIGIKRAEAILKDPEGSPWEAVVAAFESKGLTEEDALLQARLARILRHGDYNPKRMTVRLWKPAKENA
jgi:DNA polymerase-1